MPRKPKVISSRQIAIEEEGVRRTGSYIEYDDGTVTVISDEGREDSTQIGNSDVETVAQMHLRPLVSDRRTNRIKPLRPPASADEQ